MISDEDFAELIRPQWDECTVGDGRPPPKQEHPCIRSLPVWRYRALVEEAKEGRSASKTLTRICEDMHQALTHLGAPMGGEMHAWLIAEVRNLRGENALLAGALDGDPAAEHELLEAVRFYRERKT